MTFGPGEGLVGQAAVTRKPIRVHAGPETPLRVRSGLAEQPPADLVVLPVLFEGELLGVIEFASVSPFKELHQIFLERLVATIGIALNTIQANKRTEELLAQSQRLAQELQEQSAELQRTNAELEEKAALLSEQKGNIETKNREIELARIGLEEKAQQLARASAYKSEFLANMSHELRTPLNSLLLLARLLAENPERNLTPKQIEFARTIHSAGTDLLTLIDDILDLSKIEAGRTEIEPGEVAYDDIRGYVEQGFAPQAAEKGLELQVEVAPELAGGTLITDGQRLQQILRNMVSNAVKFTDAGSVTLQIAPAAAGPGLRRTHARDGPPGDRLLGGGHRDRHSRRQAGHHLRGLPAGGRHHQPALRRDRARPVDQPGSRCAARRHDHGLGPLPARAPRSRCSCRTCSCRIRCHAPGDGDHSGTDRSVDTHRAGGRVDRTDAIPRQLAAWRGLRSSSSTTTPGTCTRWPARWSCMA